MHQPTLLGGIEPAPTTGAVTERITLDDDSWVEVVREWWTGADVLADRLAAAVPWRQGRRRMWDRVLDDPRLSYWARRAEESFDPALLHMQRDLEVRYQRQLRPPGFNFYRHGQDSVAWHADRELRALDDTLVAIVTLGARRPFLIRPACGGHSVDLAPGSGDLLVMGGACQRDWEHAVPKTTRPGMRISVSWRWTATDAPIRGGVYPWLARP